MGSISSHASSAIASSVPASTPNSLKSKGMLPMTRSRPCILDVMGSARLRMVAAMPSWPPRRMRPPISAKAGARRGRRALTSSEEMLEGTFSLWTTSVGVGLTNVVPPPTRRVECSWAAEQICQSASLPVCQSADLPVCCQSASLPICQSAANLRLPICRSANLPICRSANLPICRSVSLSRFQYNKTHTIHT